MLALICDHSLGCSCPRVFEPVAKMKTSLNDEKNAVSYAPRVMPVAGMLLSDCRLMQDLPDHALSLARPAWHSY